MEAGEVDGDLGLVEGRKEAAGGGAAEDGDGEPMIERFKGQLNEIKCGKCSANEREENEKARRGRRGPRRALRPSTPSGG